MKLFSAILIVSTVTLLGFKDVNENNPALKCELTVNKSVFKLGEVPELSVKIINNTGESIYLIGSLDNSAVKRRMPYCYFNIDKPKSDTVLFYGCGTANPLSEKDFKLIKQGEVFNPYESIGDHGFFSDYASTQKETYRNPGIYKIQFHYSTNNTEIRKFRGSVDDTYWAKNYDTALIKKLFLKVPKVELASNVIEIEIRE